jgi:hypothetical protein
MPHLFRDICPSIQYESKSEFLLQASVENKLKEGKMKNALSLLFN